MTAAPGDFSQLHRSAVRITNMSTESLCLPPSNHNVSERTLVDSVKRAAVFLYVLGTNGEIAAALQQGGMTDNDIDDGRARLLDVLSLRPARKAVKNDAPAAAAELDAWARQWLPRVHVVLAREAPSTAAYVDSPARVPRGVKGVMTVISVLARVDTLASGSDASRAAQAEQDRAAVAALEALGLRREERERAWRFVRVTLGQAQQYVPADPPHEAIRIERLRALRTWFEHWSETARRQVSQRRLRRSLGLGKRRSPRATSGAAC
jgi:hypothetical protein